MASGYFPLENSDEGAKRLLAAAKLITEVADHYAEAVYCGDSGQFDSTASDGCALGMLRLAAELVRRQVRRS